MQRRQFVIATAAGAAASMLLGACGTTATTSVSKGDDPTARRRDINTNASNALSRLYSSTPGARDLVSKARGVLVFPSVIAAGLGVGGQYGDGVLQVSGAPVDYYNLASVSVGLQIGAQSKAIMFLFMTQDALDKFRASEGWSVGADASVAVLRAGANGAIDINTVQGPVVAFVLTNAGLMANLTLEGTKITKLKS
ncbi:Lipid-binding SYLF domain-containing protein [Noviherbaspirillum humi]|uniref:Lipid-binding SYLF domain-containing protein n=1 Tax=Noviherbaspirillum humi TaxID=1688639 RepID=A0A239ITM5_9BURK|nr:YSC84-related protein [Noviherbaspirillum humi]SNS96383.1 Lipid-binding SYLF domain-containing protein [Noviherbaspirillum humi]